MPRYMVAAANVMIKAPIVLHLTDKQLHCRKHEFAKVEGGKGYVPIPPHGAGFKKGTVLEIAGEIAGPLAHQLADPDTGATVYAARAAARSAAETKTAKKTDRAPADKAALV